MYLTEFSFEYPVELVAQEPITPRDASRMMLLNRKTQSFEHKHFYHLPQYFKKGDVLVLNNTKVLPARLRAFKESGGKLEVLVTQQNELGLCEALIYPSKNLKAQQKIGFDFKGKTIWALLLEPHGKIKKLQFESSVILRDLMMTCGAAPLPPYIKREAPRADDLDRYQSVFAKKEGAVAAPTASLHFTEKVLDELKSKGVEIYYITLHVGLGTFEPIKTEKIEEHQMQTEYYEVPNEVAAAIQNAKQEGRSITAVGTTVVRSLESYFQNLTTPTFILPLSSRGGGEGFEEMKSTQLFITPGYKFKIIDRFLTNFHQPESTPLLLTSAFAGKEFLNRCYEEAIDKKYRLFSYGDCMLIQ